MFQICTNHTVFLLPFSLPIIYHTFSNAYILFWYILHCSQRFWTSSCSFFGFLLSPSFSEKPSIEYSISNLSLEKRLACFWNELLVVFQKAFMLLLINSSMPNVKPKHTKSFSRLLGFYLWNQEHIQRWPFEKHFLSLISLFLLSMNLITLHQITGRNTHVTENLH